MLKVNMDLDFVECVILLSASILAGAMLLFFFHNHTKLMVDNASCTLNFPQEGGVTQEESSWMPL